MELKQKVARLDKELAFQAILIENYNNHVTSLIDNLKNLRKVATSESCPVLLDIEKLINDVEHQQKAFSWVKLKEIFSDIPPYFIQMLLEKHPQLTPSEIKLCTLLHFNLDTKEIAAITSQTYDTIRVARTRLRKKLGLQNEDSLVVYLMQL